MAIASGLVHNVAGDDHGALDQIRGYLSYFPSSAWSYPPRRAGADSGPRLVDELLSIVPRDNRRVYDMRSVVDVLVDDGDWFEVQPSFGQAIVCGLAHLGGDPIAVVANQPTVLAGSIDVDAADKAAHFIMVADSFHLPLVFLADNPGMLPGTASERAGILRSGARMFAAQSVATTAKLHITLRKAYGFGSMVMSMVGFDGQSATFAFPGATLGAMGAAASSRALGADADRAAALRQAELRRVLPVRRRPRVRRVDRSPRGPRRAAAGHGARPPPPAGGAHPCQPRRHHPLGGSMSNPFSFAGKQVVVTGGTSGVGAALVGLLTELGAHQVTVIDVKQPSPGVAFVRADLSDPASVDAAAAAVEGPVDALFNNAGVAATLPTAVVMSVNYLGPRRLTDRLLDRMPAGAAVTYTASIAGGQWPQRLGKIQELLDIDGWADTLKWIDAEHELITDAYSFSKECVQVHVIRTSKATASARCADQQRVPRHHRHAAHPGLRGHHEPAAAGLDRDPGHRPVRPAP